MIVRDVLIGQMQIDHGRPNVCVTHNSLQLTLTGVANINTTIVGKYLRVVALLDSDCALRAHWSVGFLRQLLFALTLFSLESDWDLAIRKSETKIDVSIPKRHFSVVEAENGNNERLCSFCHFGRRTASVPPPR
jgi:hypothetical protein